MNITVNAASMEWNELDCGQSTIKISDNEVSLRLILILMLDGSITWSKCKMNFHAILKISNLLTLVNVDLPLLNWLFLTLMVTCVQYNK